jgi:hypothetical protein
VPPNSRQADSIDVEIIDIDIIDGQAWAVMSEDDLVELLVVLASKHEQSRSETSMMKLRSDLKDLVLQEGRWKLRR